MKELKDDAVLEIKVNKAYYNMLKAALLYVFNLEEDPVKRQESIKNSMSKEYGDLTDYERTFRTITLAIAEIENVAKKEDLFETLEIKEPNDEGYEEPNQDLN
jgi:hypothetical protein